MENRRLPHSWGNRRRSSSLGRGLRRSDRPRRERRFGRRLTPESRAETKFAGLARRLLHPMQRGLHSARVWAFLRSWGTDLATAGGFPFWPHGRLRGRCFQGLAGRAELSDAWRLTNCISSGQSLTFN